MKGRLRLSCAGRFTARFLAFGTARFPHENIIKRAVAIPGNIWQYVSRWVAVVDALENRKENKDE